MPVEPEDFRRALRKVASGVTVVTVSSEGTLHGMTASSFASVSLSPPLVLVCLDKSSVTGGLVKEAGSFAVNVLAAHQTDVSDAFAKQGVKPFASLSHSPGKLGHPLLDDAIAWIECRIHEVLDGGDHEVVIGLVEHARGADGSPLLYFDQRYGSLNGE